MALSLSNFLYRILPLILQLNLVQHVHAVTHRWNWTVDWVIRNPDGLKERPVMALNGQWPLPLLNVTMGDRIIINLHNGV